MVNTFARTHEELDLLGHSGGQAKPIGEERGTPEANANRFVSSNTNYFPSENERRIHFL